MTGNGRPHVRRGLPVARPASGVRPVLRTVVVGLLLAGALVGLGAGPAGAQALKHPVLVIGVAGLGGDDVGPDTPAIAALAARGAVGVLSVKALPAVSCPADGWLTLGAGARAGSFTDPCAELGALSAADVARRNAQSRDGAVVGLLSSLVPARLDGAGAELVGTSSVDARLTVVDAGSVRHDVDLAAGGPASGTDSSGGSGSRPSIGAGGDGSLAEVDARVGAAVAAAGPAADVLLVGVSESPGETGRARLHVAIAAGPAFPRGSLTSASTGRGGYVQLIDVAPTVLALAGVAQPEQMDGQPWQVRGDPSTLTDLRHLAQRAEVGKAVTVPFVAVYLGALLLALVLLRRRPAALRVAALAGVAAPGVSYAVMLVPWWRAPSPLAVLLGLVLVGSLVVAVLAARTRSPVGVVCAATFGLLVLDLLTGAHLQIEAPAGYSSLVAGRFSGLGNIAFGVYGTAALLAAAGTRRLPVVAAVGVLAVVVDGAPPWGSDVGGVLALVPAFTVLMLLLSGARVSVVRVLLAGLGGAAAVLAFGIVDYARPAGDRTHLGRFVGQVVDGSAGEVLSRKASAVLGLVFANPVTAFLPLVAVGVAVLLLRPPPALAATFAVRPSYRSGVLAVGVLALVGFVVNDSGAAVVALAIAVAVPATVAVTAQERERPPDADRAKAGQADGPAGPP